jgi:NAD(P)-dependent dehydrogenase (short-subunit alcohol dehydrogenase family)
LPICHLLSIPSLSHPQDNYSRSSAPAEATVQKILTAGSKAGAIKADISQPSKIVELFTKAVAEFGHLDIVCFHAGLDTVSPAGFNRIIAFNTRGSIAAVQDIARVTRFRVSDDAGWVSGQAVTISGGATK